MTYCHHDKNKFCRCFQERARLDRFYIFQNGLFGVYLRVLIYSLLRYLSRDEHYQFQKRLGKHDTIQLEVFA